MRYFLETYGCQMNKAESAAFELALRERQWSRAEQAQKADLVLINTCSVRATAETRARGRIAFYAAEKKRRSFSLVVLGCMAERLGAKLISPGSPVDYVLGPTEAQVNFPALLEAIESGRPYIKSLEKPRYSFASSHLEAGAFRAFVPIMHGCNNYCTYCIVPYVRGPEISRSPESILQEIALLEANAVKEITLLGQNVNSYHWLGDGGPLDFPGLLEVIAKRTRSIQWIRFLSSHPKDFSARLVAVMRETPKLCRHLHLCVQHGSDPILAAMNRRYNRDDYLRLVDSLRAALPEISLSTDILIGFPGESEADLEATLDLMRQVRFLYAYMYHFNPREGTAAFSLTNRVPDKLKKERLARVIELQALHTRQLLQARVASQARVLVEGVSQKNSAELLGRSEHDEMVVFPGNTSLIGEFAQVRLAALQGHTFRAKEVFQCPGAPYPI